jgi:hypothetical protein
VTTACVKRRKLDDFGNAVGMPNPNPILAVGLIEFPNGAEAEHALQTQLQKRCGPNAMLTVTSANFWKPSLTTSRMGMQFNMLMVTSLSLMVAST